MSEKAVLMTSIEHSNAQIAANIVSSIHQKLVGTDISFNSYQRNEYQGSYFVRWGIDDLTEEQKQDLVIALRKLQESLSIHWRLCKYSSEPVSLGLFVSSNTIMMRELIDCYSASVSPSSLVRLSFVFAESQELADIAAKFGVPCYVLDSNTTAFQAEARYREVLQRYKPDLVCSDSSAKSFSSKLLKDFKGDSLRTVAASVPHSGRFGVHGDLGSGQYLLASCVLEGTDVNASKILVQAAEQLTAQTAVNYAEISQLVEAESLLEAIDKIVQCRVMRSNHGVFVFD